MEFEQKVDENIVLKLIIMVLDFYVTIRKLKHPPLLLSDIPMLSYRKGSKSDFQCFGKGGPFFNWGALRGKLNSH